MGSRDGIANLSIMAGLLLIVAGLVARADGGSTGSLAGLILVLAGVICTLIGVGVRVLPFVISRQARSEHELFESGTKATAVVERVETTGKIINSRNVRIMLGLRVRPRSEPEFTYERKLLVPISGVPQVGDLIDVAYHPDDKSKVALATDWSSDAGFGRLLVLRPPDEPTAAEPLGWQLDRGSDAESSAVETATSRRASADRVIELLERLHRLRQDGVLTEAEFEQQKAQVLSDRAT